MNLPRPIPARFGWALCPLCRWEIAVGKDALNYARHYQQKHEGLLPTAFDYRVLAIEDLLVELDVQASLLRPPKLELSSWVRAWLKNPDDLSIDELSVQMDAVLSGQPTENYVSLVDSPWVCEALNAATICYRKIRGLQK